jgi:glucan biosynthesis protein C
MEMKTVTRRYDLDWLRVLTILCVFVFHSTRFFNLSDWHVKNQVTYVCVQALEDFMMIWMMPLIFLISGASIFYAMRKSSVGKFIKDKVLRLLIPLLVAMFTYSSLHIYLERTTHGQFTGSYFDFLPHYFNGLYFDVGSSGNFAFHGMHMWYVMILFLFCLIFYPLFKWWQGKGHGTLDKLGSLLAAPWTTWLALAFPILILNIFISDSGLELGAGGWPFVSYAFFLLYGFIIITNERLQANIQRMRWFTLLLGIILGIGYVFLSTNATNPVIAPWEDALGDTFYILAACSLLPTFLGFGMRYMTKNTRFLKYSSEAVMGFYILHQTVLLVIGYFIVKWGISDFAKWVLITAVSFLVIMVVYEFVVRRVHFLRFLCGMKLMTRPVNLQIKETQLKEATRMM